jgi:uncharacterized protein YggE
MRWTIAVVALVPVIASAQVAARTGTSGPEIVAVGTAEVRLRPDRASMTVSVTVRDTSATEAGRVNAERMSALLAALRRQGVPDSAMATSGFSIEIEEAPFDQPAPPVDEPPVYVAENSVRFTLTDLAAIGRLVDTVLAAGASGVGGITYSSSQAAEGRRRAIALAVADARGDAEAAAQAAGGQLGELLELVLTPTYGIIKGAAAASLYGGDALSQTTILVPTTVDVNAAVSMRFRFVARR